MLSSFISRLSENLELQGYQIGNPTVVPGVQALLYAFTPGRQRMAFAKVEDHFLFVDWSSVTFGRLEGLIAIYKRFSGQVNQCFPVPHALRMQIPNLVIAAISMDPFPPETAHFVRTSNLTPWYGGETGQIILISMGNYQVISQFTSGPSLRPIPGAIPLNHAVNVIWSACQASFPPI